MNKKDFSRNPWHLEYLSYALIAVGILSTVIALSTGKTFLINNAILPTILGIVFFVVRKAPIASFKEDHLELKLAPLAAKTFIRYDKINAIEVEEKKIIIDIADKKKPLKLPVSLFRAEDREPAKQAFSNLKTKGNV